LSKKFEKPYRGMKKNKKYKSKRPYNGPDAGKLFLFLSSFLFLFLCLSMYLLTQWKELALLVIIYYVSINITTFVMFYIDKLAAIKGFIRIPEKNLHYLEFLGGSFASHYAQKKIRHKNKKESFNNLSIVALFFHITIIVIMIMFLAK